MQLLSFNIEFIAMFSFVFKLFCKGNVRFLNHYFSTPFNFDYNFFPVLLLRGNIFYMQRPAPQNVNHFDFDRIPSGSEIHFFSSDFLFSHKLTKFQVGKHSQQHGKILLKTICLKKFEIGRIFYVTQNLSVNSVTEPRKQKKNSIG